jgi:hypothetical protein
VTRLALAALLVTGCATTVPATSSAVAPGAKRQEAASTRHPLGKHRPRHPHSLRVSRSLRRSPVAHDWSKVAACESGGNWHDTAGLFEGGLQFLHSTWVAEGGRDFAEHAYDATELEQILVAERLLRTAGIGSWPVCGRYLRSSA